MCPRMVGGSAGWQQFRRQIAFKTVLIARQKVSNIAFLISLSSVGKQDHQVLVWVPRSLATLKSGSLAASLTKNFLLNFPVS